MALGLDLHTNIVRLEVSNLLLLCTPSPPMVLNWVLTDPSGSGRRFKPYD